MNTLISYAYDFVSYLVLQPQIDKINIRKIILFGSVARGETTKKSDIDIFIDTLDDEPKTSEIIKKYLDNFLLSDRIKKWRLLGTENEIHLIIGNLDSEKWSEMKRSMEDNTIVLFNKFNDVSKKKSNLVPYSLIKWSTETGNPNERVKISRFIYGYKMKGKSYPGFLIKSRSKQIGNSVLLVNSDNTNNITSFLKNNKIKSTSKIIYIDE
jgi:predicted nucleotidyltransferase